MPKSNAQKGNSNIPFCLKNLTLSLKNSVRRLKPKVYVYLYTYIYICKIQIRGQDKKPFYPPQRKGH